MSKEQLLNRGRRVIGVGAVMLACAAAASPAALALSPASTTLRGGAGDGGSPDSAGLSQVYPDATLTGKVASGTLETDGRYGGVGNGSYYAFNGHVTCMLVIGNRVIIGALGTASKHQEGYMEGVTPLPGSYMQVAEIEFGHFFSGGIAGNIRSNHAFQSLGPYHEGEPGSVAPSCRTYATKMRGGDPASEWDTLNLSPSITSPVDGRTYKAGPIRLAGSGEPNTAIELFDGSFKPSFVSVNANGKWSTTLYCSGEESFYAMAVLGSSVPSNTVTFNAF